MASRGTPPLHENVLQGTLDVLILKTLVLGPAHGHAIAFAIERSSDDVLQIEHGSLYPALHRLEDRGWITSSWAPRRTTGARASTSSRASGAGSSPSRPGAGKSSRAR